VIDGEAVVLGVDGIADFNALHSRRHDDETTPIGKFQITNASEDSVFIRQSSGKEVGGRRNPRPNIGLDEGVLGKIQEITPNWLGYGELKCSTAKRLF
jgi:hypothetical protein